VWLHGAAADGAARRLGQTGMLPHDIFYDLGRLFSESGR
jgi:ADP-dependent NAD(P)H-hydrate dehydratase